MKTTVQLLREFSLPLIAGVIVALVWANVSFHSYQAVLEARFIGTISLHFATNDLFMVLFFGIAAVEITSSIAPGGSLNPPSKAINPLLATVGGVIGPIVVFLAANAIFGDPALRRGWGIPTATDIALAWLVAQLIFGKGHPAVSFLLLLAVTDDAIGLIIIAVFYPDPLHPVQLWPLGLIILGMLICWGLRRAGMNNYWPYLLGGGVPSWAGLYLAHLHPALALVVIVPWMPHRALAGDDTAFDLHEDDLSTLARFEHDWKIIVDFGLFLFGLANAGVRFSSVGPITWIVLVSLLLGKTIGIFGFGMIARLMGFPLPTGLGKRELFIVGMVGGVGLTVALFVSGEAYTDSARQGAAKMGALLSAWVGIISLVLARAMGIKARSA